MSKFEKLANTTVEFSDNFLTLNAPVFDPRLELDITTEYYCEVVEALEKRFDEWFLSTPDFWYENIKSFEEWIDDVWDWIREANNSALCGE